MTMSRWPSAAVALRMNVSPPATLETSPTIPMHELPIFVAASVTRLASRPQIATRTPSFANA
ncbi:unannotated protein [freshwater metagenome]|uniref:Unannotated protein n=1 Tax=freshwater metagenome TaxID=449393 RepID=A0A6J7UGB0_9ZZZZ